MANSPKPVFSTVRLEDYLYTLPEEAIAKHPLAKRDESRLLVYQEGAVTHRKFKEVVDLLSTESLLFFNNTKVIPARILLEKETGARIEIFLLQPVAPNTIISEVLAQTASCTWQCMIGNQKRWKEGTSLERTIHYQGKEVTLKALLENKEKGLVKFHWEADQLSFAELVEATGEVPLPPYLNRKAEESDKPRYQTVYSKEEGAVAAPTAGLHFTQEVLESLKQKGIATDYLTLHVGAGTFRPIKDSVEHHPMHREQLVVSAGNIRNLLAENRKVIAVGTTSMRTLESLYWYGVKLMVQPDAPFYISKEEAYSYKEESLPTPEQAFKVILEFMKKENKEALWGETEIFIVPGYTFRVCRGLITNFHQPESTLILLIAAFVGADWRKIYQEALSKGYRFLSYGDSSLLLPD